MRRLTLTVAALVLTVYTNCEQELPQVREWRIVGFSHADRVIDPEARPLVAKMRVGDRIVLTCQPQETQWGPFPTIRWVNSNSRVARLEPTGGVYAELFAIEQGETELFATVDVYGGVRADLWYHCCSPCVDPVLPSCEGIRMSAIRVVR